MDKNPKIAMIGIGRWGQKILESLTKQKADISCYFSNGNKDNADWIKQRFPLIPLANSYQSILEDTTIRAVIIATPINTHFDLSMKALKKGKHVFVEKPGTESVKDMDALYAEADWQKLVLHVGYVFTHHPAFRKLMEIARKENVRSIHFQWDKLGTFGEDILLNLVSHEISLIEALGFDIDQETLGHSAFGAITPADIFRASMRTTTGIPITISINRVSPTKNKTVTMVTDQKAYCWQNDELFEIKEGSAPSTLHIGEGRALDLEMADFLSSIKTGHAAGRNLATKVLSVIEKLR